MPVAFADGYRVRMTRLGIDSHIDIKDQEDVGIVEAKLNLCNGYAYELRQGATRAPRVTFSHGANLQMSPDLMRCQTFQRPQSGI
jgi:hypothetical protein